MILTFTTITLNYKFINLIRLVHVFISHTVITGLIQVREVQIYSKDPMKGKDRIQEKDIQTCRQKTMKETDPVQKKDFQICRSQ